MAVGVPGMRDDQRHPMPRGSTLVAEENSAHSGTARPSVSAAPAQEDGPITAVNDRDADPSGPAPTTSEPPESERAGLPAEVSGPTGGRGAGPSDDTDEFGRVPGPGEAADVPAVDAHVDDAGPAGTGAAPESGAAAPAPLRLATVNRTAEPSEPSWARVLVTTVSLWTSRRLRRRTRPAGAPAAEAAGGATQTPRSGIA